MREYYPTPPAPVPQLSRRMLRLVLGLSSVCLISLLGADSSSAIIRVSGTIQAIHSVVIQVPMLQGGQNGQVTLVKLAPNGASVKAGDLLAQFDSTSQLKAAREAQAKYDDLSHQVEQKDAEHKSNVEKRLSELQTAEADLKKAAIEIRKGPILSEIDQLKNAVKQDDAHEHVESLKRSSRAHDTVELGEIRVLELQRDRQKVNVERQAGNAEKLALRAPIGGMVALQNIFRNNSLGHAEEGDQLYSGSPLIQLFDPNTMQVAADVGEPDGRALKLGTRALVHIDAFPELTLKAHFDTASPVASASLGSSVKTFNARFILDETDSRLVPDLSAAVEVRLSQ